MYISQPTQSCPICNRPVEPSQRYPRYACEDCVSKAKSIEGRPLLFSNEGFSGGFVAEYADTDVSYTAMNGTSTESNVAQMSTDLAGLWSNLIKVILIRTSAISPVKI